MSLRPRPVFYDPKGHRARVTNAVGVLTALATSIGLTVLVFGVLVAPSLPALPASVAEATVREGSSGWTTPAREEPRIGAMYNRYAPASAEHTKRYAFFETEPGSFASLQRHAEAIDALIPEWLFVDGVTRALRQVSPGEEATVNSWIKQHARHLEIYPQLASKLAASVTASTLAHSSKRSSLVNDAAAYVRKNDYRGLAVSFPELPATSHTHLVMFLKELGNQIRPEGRKIILVVPPNDESYRYQELARSADYLLITTHDQNSHPESPGPIASQGWFESQIAAQVASVDRSKLIIGLGSFGREWGGADEARYVSVQAAWEAMEQARAELRFDQQTLNPSFNFFDSRGLQHQIWFLDGVTGFNQAKAALALQPAGLAVWRLGLEDPSIWASVGRGRLPDQSTLERLEHPAAGPAAFSRLGEPIYSFMPEEREGQRTISYNKDLGLVVQQSMKRVPREVHLATWPAKDSRLIALTFDDGPDEKYTGKVLDILAEKSAEATFFVTGKNAIKFPTLLKRIYDEGHDVGNHTYSHPDLAERTSREIEIEINATQRVFESQLGIHSIFFRPPFVSSTFLKELEAPRIVETASRLGYVTVSVSADPYDWAGPTVRQIEERAVRRVLENRGQIMLLHDSGGNRDATLAALPRIIDRLKQHGFRFVTLHELIGMPRQEVMPAIDAKSHSTIAAANIRGAILQGLNWLGQNLPTLAIAATILGVLRLILIIAAAFAHKRRERRRSALAWRPSSVAVLVPAYNEEKVICKTVQSLLASSGQARFDIIVIDDGSSDRTADVVRETFAGNDRVKVFRKPNGGKSAALNFGVSQTGAEVIVAIDADTVLAHDAIDLLVRHFGDPSVGAVAGTATVGNQINLMTRFQALEYTTSQNFDRRAFEMFNAIAVVPGAIGAWRRQAIVEAGGYSSDTLAEDADLTVAIQRRNWKVLYEPRAFARTEAPETARAFLKQRFRWMFGTLQMAFKHAGAMVSVKPRGIAFITIPNVLLFQFAFTLIAPIMDVMLVWMVAAALTSGMTPADQGSLLIVARYWLLFQALDVVAAALAMKLDEGSKNLALLPLLLIQRFCYRQLLYFVAVRTVLAAMKGHFVGWGKLVRTGRVTPHLATGGASSGMVLARLDTRVVASMETGTGWGALQPARAAHTNQRGA